MVLNISNYANNMLRILKDIRTVSDKIYICILEMSFIRLKI